MTETKYPPQMIDQLAAAALIDCVKRIKDSRTSNIEALNEITWLSDEGRAWIELLDVGLPVQKFDDWLFVQRVRRELSVWLSSELETIRLELRKSKQSKQKEAIPA